MLRPTVSRLVCVGDRHPSWTHDQIYITVRQLQVCLYGAPSLTRGLVCSLQLLVVLTSAVVLGSESHKSYDRILLSHILESTSLENNCDPSVILPLCSRYSGSK
jgi:hypothetical protein